MNDENDINVVCQKCWDLLLEKIELAELLENIYGVWRYLVANKSFINAFFEQEAIGKMEEKIREQINMLRGVEMEGGYGIVSWGAKISPMVELPKEGTSEKIEEMLEADNAAGNLVNLDHIRIAAKRAFGLFMDGKLYLLDAELDDEGRLLIQNIKFICRGAEISTCLVIFPDGEEDYEVATFDKKGDMLP
ncbi:hypothetical protein KKG71_04740 [Patescibacteria group bacterium]|nr:hypothetical protein [Patescibacteria group bacterium]